MSRTPVATTDYSTIFLERAEAWSEDQRAWPLYRQALIQLDLEHPPEWMRDEKIDAFYWDGSYAQTPNFQSDHWPDVAHWFELRRDALDLLRRGSERPGLGFVIQRDPTTYTEEDRRAIPDLNRFAEDAFAKNAPPLVWTFDAVAVYQRLLRACIYLRIDALRAAEIGDGATSIASIRAMLRIAAHCQEIPGSIGIIFAHRIERTAYSTINEILSRGDEIWSETQLRDLAQLVAAGEPDYRREFAGNRAFFQDVLQRLYSDDGHGDGRMTKQGLEWMQNYTDRINVDAASTKMKNWLEESLGIPYAYQTYSLPLINVRTASRTEMTAYYDRQMELFLLQNETPLWKKVAQQPDDWDNAETRSKYWLAWLFLPMPPRGECQTFQGYRDGALIGLALERYRRNHGVCPARLNELVPDYLSELPVDRINGTPLIYKLIDGAPIVYGTGVDGIDENGKLDEWCYGLWTEHPTVMPPNSLAKKSGDWVVWSLLPEHQPPAVDARLKREAEEMD
ncbi:MAG: hypothetical protein QM811_08775 [Pirellulales bacterium]